MKKKVKNLKFFIEKNILVEDGFVKKSSLIDYFQRKYSKNQSKSILQILGFTNYEKRNEYENMKNIYYHIDNITLIKEALLFNSALLNPNYHYSKNLLSIIHYYETGVVKNFDRPKILLNGVKISDENLLKLDCLFFVDLTENQQVNHVILNQIKDIEPNHMIVRIYQAILYDKKSELYLKNFQYLKEKKILDEEKIDYQELSQAFSQSMGIFQPQFKSLHKIIDMKQIILNEKSQEFIKIPKKIYFNDDYLLDIILENKTTDDWVLIGFKNDLQAITPLTWKILNCEHISEKLDFIISNKKLHEFNLLQQDQLYLQSCQKFYKKIQEKNQFIAIQNSLELKSQNMTAYDFQKAYDFFFSFYSALKQIIDNDKIILSLFQSCLKMEEKDIAYFKDFFKSEKIEFLINYLNLKDENLSQKIKNFQLIAQKYDLIEQLKIDTCDKKTKIKL